MCVDYLDAPPGRAPRSWDRRTLLLIVWLEEYFTLHGERMPNRNEIVLPYGTVQTEIYEHYKKDVANPVSRSHIYKKWKDNFQFVKAKKVIKMLSLIVN
ncbi:hypothetical protein DPMN_045429 [Dreissena polymorpha]|uniref:Uncharacterized protein n=1 Tax=Dreissena polymorpha TaxID=45954 RepID=A0A9D4D6J1_DREPO|nr:hypothetical protein DPMN_045429 [Dreissena polymorpha]